MLGPATMATSIEKNKFKGGFGNPDPPIRRAYTSKAKVSTKNNTRKLISFFDSQKVDRFNLYQPMDDAEGA